MTRQSKPVALKEATKISRNRCNNPFALPNDEQLWALYHFRNKHKPPPDTWKLSHTLRDDESKQAQEREAYAKLWDHKANLMKELKKRGAPAFFSRIGYMLDMRKLAQLRLIVGVKRDGCIQLDQQAEVERARFTEIKNEYKTCVAAMEQFLERDHEKSMGLLSLADSEYNRTIDLSDRRDELSRLYGSTRLEVYHWEEAWRTVKACHRFMLKVSPVTAQVHSESHDSSGLGDPKKSQTVGSEISAKSMSFSGENPEDALMNLELDYDSSLESLIAAFEKETSEMSKKLDKTPADLGLNTPADLVNIFRAIEQQNLNALINLEALNGPMADTTQRITETKLRIKSEIEDVYDKINELERAIQREEERARRLERQSTKLVQRGFKELICSEQALRMRVLIQDAYEACVQGQGDVTGQDSLQMTRALESLYEQLSSELDKLPRALVHEVEREGFRAEMRASHEADEAMKKFELMNRLIAALRRLMEPSPPKYRKLMKRSRPPVEVSSEEQTAESKATQFAENLLYMELFGKKCNARKALEAAESGLTGVDDDDDDDD